MHGTTCAAVGRRRIIIHGEVVEASLVPLIVFQAPPPLPPPFLLSHATNISFVIYVDFVFREPPRYVGGDGRES